MKVVGLAAQLGSGSGKVWQGSATQTAPFRRPGSVSQRQPRRHITVQLHPPPALSGAVVISPAQQQEASQQVM